MAFINNEIPVSHFENIIEDLKSKFRFRHFIQNGLAFIYIKSEFNYFIENSHYPEKYRNFFNYYYVEKLFEHFISIKLLNFNKNDVFIDIAAQKSYFSDYIYKFYGIEAYKQDLDFRKGIFCSPDSAVPLVGGDAADLPFKDNYFTKMTLHCSIEHFENDSDIKFIREAERVLKKGGKACILPLYFGESYFAIIDHEAYSRDEDSIQFEKGIDVYEKEGYGNRFGRIYSIDKFKERLVDSNNLDLDIYFIDNLEKIDNSLYCSLAAVFSKKR
ncbi:MAG: class I SAM-dependent methyltransferase [Methanotrichaceae archaeon]|nr:class I SAM-dependent methyltransferase [Methanotrichaceae archaeon]